MHTDIRRFMPQTPQTDPDKFPDYVYQPFPRMMTHEAGGKKVPYKDAGGNPVIVQNATEEANFLSRHNRGDEVKSEPKAEAVTIQQIVAEPVQERKKPGPKPKLAHVETKLPEPLT